jgi:Flp pilus assembly protein TadG
MVNRIYAKRSAGGVTGRLRRLRCSQIDRGQAAVEFAMASILFLVMMMVGVQFAMIGQAALALSQGASAIARYAAVNSSTYGAGYSGAPDANMQNLLS